MKFFLSKLYILGFLALTVFFMFLIWNVTFGHIIEEYETRNAVIEVKKEHEQKAAKEELSFQKIILEGGEKRVKRYLGYRVLEEMKIEGHFHHIDYDMVPDNRSSCITCHGDIPHNMKKEVRAFMNMHAAFVACETCHVRLEKKQKTGVFKWYNRKTGEIIPSPIKEGVPPGRYRAKIIPFEHADGVLQRIDTQSRIEFARDYKESEKHLSDLQKAKAKKIIHKMVSEGPYVCEECHRDKEPLLPFKDLGYPEKRINLLVSSEVVGMIRNYTQFFVPRMLQPGFGKE